jgi:hypothetical protein
MDRDEPNGKTDLMIADALRSEFGLGSLIAARSMLVAAVPEARAAWQRIITMLEEDGGADQTPPVG